MPNIAVVGAQWGDEGKGKIVDLLSERFDVVARYQGGPNAGHTVTFGGKRYALHHIPSGAFRPRTRMVVGSGTVIDLGRLLGEMEALAADGVELTGRLFISDRAHVILPPLAQLDALAEDPSQGEARLGTTQRGIGPAYEMKAARLAVRIADLADPDHLRRIVRRLIGGPVGQRLRAGGVEPGDPERIAAEAQDQGRRLEPFVADTTTLLNRWMDEGQSVLFEGAQGTMLDIDHGSFPYVTSSNTVAGGLCTGLGVAPTRVDGIVGVFKAYTTRVGLGPMPTELEDGPDGFGQRIRTRGREYGTTTGRPRRCGWFDGAAAAWANRINRFDAVCVMLLDVLDEFDEIRVGTGYRLDGQRIDAMPACIARAARVEAAYESCRGWRTDTTGISRWEDLPSRAIEYVDFLGSVVGAEPALVSVGPDRAQTLLRPESWLVRTIGL